MNVQTFIDNYREAFGENAPLPIAFYYSDTAIAETPKIFGCFFQVFEAVRNGQPASLNGDIISCGGGKLYTGFAPMPEHVPTFVSGKEHYKRIPQDVIEYVDSLQIQPADNKYLNFVRIDQLDSFDKMEGLLFFATPDMLSGLAMWAFFDNNSEDAVSSIFGSGCSSIVSLAVRENRMNGKRTFIGMFDPSARPYVGANELSFVIPACRFRTMYDTMRDSCLFDTRAWSKLKERINPSL